jgi:hypothetical protein
MKCLIQLVPGLYLQVHPSGAKSWTCRYRFAGQSRKLTIGSAYTEGGIEVIKLADARDITDEHRVTVTRRIDPGEAKRRSGRRRRRAAENTLRAVAREYLDQHAHLRTNKNQRSTFKRLVYPVLGDRQIETIKRSEIAALLDDMAKSRGPAMADRVVAYLRAACLNWAVAPCQ